QSLDVDVLELDLHRAARVDLEGDLAVAGDLGVLLLVLDRRDAVDRKPDLVAHRSDDVLVPAVLVEGVERLLRGGDERPVAAGLVVERGPVAVAEVGLIAGHLVAGDADAPELDAAVALAVDHAEGE